MGRHAEWRKLAKKLRRKRIRTMIAVARDQKLLEEQRKREQSPTYRAWLEEQKVLEEFNAAEEKRLAMQRQQQWESEEEAALMRWREQQSRLAQAKAEKFKREMMIKEEWEREQRKLQEAEEARKKSEDEKKRKQAELLAQIDAFIEGKADLPDEVNISTQTQPGHPDCPFFSKTGACRFRDSCSRNHTRPGISKTLLIPNFYDHFGLTTLHQEEYDTDLSLEYEDSETYQHFKEFYNDVLPEFEQCGKVIQFKVCNNEEPHLRGNVYVEFQSRRHALKAYRTFQGRFYAGRRLNVEFTNIPSWKNAVCGLFHRRKCPKGKTCNFLHVFRNPNNAFKIQNGHSSSSRRHHSRSRSRSPRQRSRSKEWNWSDGSDSESDRTKRRTRSRSPSRSRLHKKKDDSDPDDKGCRRSKSRSPQRNKVHYRKRSRSHERDRGRKEGKEKNRDEKYRSISRSPQRDKKHYSVTKERKSKKDKTESRNKIETNGKYENHKTSTKFRDDGKNRTIDCKYDKVDYREYSGQSKKPKGEDKNRTQGSRNNREIFAKQESNKQSNKNKHDEIKYSGTDDNDKEENYRRHTNENVSKSKKRYSEDRYSSYKGSSDSECNGKESNSEKRSDSKSKKSDDL